MRPWKDKDDYIEDVLDSLERLRMQDLELKDLKRIFISLLHLSVCKGFCKSDLTK